MLKQIKSLKNLIGNTFGSARTGGEFLLRETDFGTIHVEADIIRRIIERMKVTGVHEIKNVIIDLPSVNTPLQIKLNLIIGQDYSAPVIGANLRDAIKDELKNYFEITNALFDIRVTKINPNLPETKKRRVR